MSSKITYTNELATALSDVPHLWLGGRLFFEKAAHRDLAASLINLPDSPVRSAVVTCGKPRGLHSPRYHLSNSDCERRNWIRWSPKTLARTLNMKEFGEIPKKSRCSECHYEYMAKK